MRRIVPETDITLGVVDFGDTETVLQMNITFIGEYIVHIRREGRIRDADISRGVDVGAGLTERPGRIYRQLAGRPDITRDVAGARDLIFRAAFLRDEVFLDDARPFVHAAFHRLVDRAVIDDFSR